MTDLLLSRFLALQSVAELWFLFDDREFPPNSASVGAEMPSAGGTDGWQDVQEP